MEKDYGNDEWTDGVPSGLTIAEVVIERIHEQGWQKAWSSCDGLDICPRWTRLDTGMWVERPGTYVFLAGYQDLDYEQAYLLTVATQTDEDTFVDYLAVYQAHAGTRNLDVEWAQRPHAIFDATIPMREVLHWWVDTAEAQRECMQERRRQGAMKPWGW